MGHTIQWRSKESARFWSDQIRLTSHREGPCSLGLTAFVPLSFCCIGTIVNQLRLELHLTVLCLQVWLPGRDG
jgi:hypothetical protein